MLAQRVIGLVDRVAGYEPLAGLGVGLFGASTGAAAALVAASTRPEAIRAVSVEAGRVSPAKTSARCGNRYSLIVGGRDVVVIKLNLSAMRTLAGEARPAIVPAATHLFSEPGALEQMAWLAADWFTRYPTKPERATVND